MTAGQSAKEDPREPHRQKEGRWQSLTAVRGDGGSLLALSFLLCEKGKLTFPTPWGPCRDEISSCTEYLEYCLE